jgi:hypothetical protein
MPCCGKARTQLQGTISSQRPKPAPSVASQPQAQPHAGQSSYFSYFGKTGLTVSGPASSRIYRFLANGAPIAVDARDASALARVPNLRQVRHV